MFVTYSTLISKGSRDGRGARVPLPDEPEPEGGYGEDSDNDNEDDGTDEFGMPGAQPYVPRQYGVHGMLTGSPAYPLFNLHAVSCSIGTETAARFSCKSHR